jgi:predicted ATPase
MLKNQQINGSNISEDNPSQMQNQQNSNSGAESTLPPKYTINHRLAVPAVLGQCAKFTFHDLCGLPLGSADYLELCRRYGAFIITNVPRMSFREKDLARRFIVFIDAVYESKVVISRPQANYRQR